MSARAGDAHRPRASRHARASSSRRGGRWQVARAVALLIGLAVLSTARAEDAADKAGKPFDLGRVVVPGRSWFANIGYRF